MAAHQKGALEEFILSKTKQYASPIFKSSLFGERVVILSGVDANKFLFSNEEKLFNRWRPRTVQKLFPSMEFVPIEHDHKKGKKYVSFLFKNDTRRKLVATIDSIARNQLQILSKTLELEVYPLANMYSFAIACKVFMSVDDPEELSELLHYFNIFNRGIITLHVNLPGTLFYRAIKAGEILRKKIGYIVKKRRELLAENKVSPDEDILTHMLAVPDENGQFMSELEITDKILSLIVGGHHTTSSIITFAIKYLSEMPLVYDQVKKEQIEISKSVKPEVGLGWEDVQRMKCISNLVNEVLRHRSIVQISFRETTTDITYKGFTIPKGWKIYWSPTSTQKNAKYFLKPEEFDPSRFEGNGPRPYTFVPFGIGPRMCPGNELSRVMSLVFLDYWLKRCTWEVTNPNEKVKINVTPIPVQGFPVRVSPLTS